MASTGESVTSGLDLSGRRAVITGANSGLGRECARVLALRGANVVMACRSQERATAVVEEFAREMGRDVASRCEILPCDLADMTSVRDLAATLVAAGRPIDVLLFNAGVSNQPYTLTADGIEATFAANYLGHFLLLHLLAAGGALAPAARIVTPLSSAEGGERCSGVCRPRPCTICRRWFRPDPRVGERQRACSRACTVERREEARRVRRETFALRLSG
ncbi:MAG: SDR family NAD(P)-dependent oxidoreductase [Polyangiaceae bacterium]